jgi:hypothetical protein
VEEVVVLVAHLHHLKMDKMEVLVAEALVIFL